MRVVSLLYAELQTISEVYRMSTKYYGDLVAAYSQIF
jgi:hypothetical protein